MNKKEVISEAAKILRSKSIRKSVTVPAQDFTISDNEGNSKVFSVKKTGLTVPFSNNDISMIFDACLQVIKNNLMKGIVTSFQGFGTFGVKYRPPRTTKLVNTDDEILIKGRFVPKFTFGKDLKMCANVYGVSVKDVLPDSENIYIDESYEVE